MAAMWSRLPSIGREDAEHAAGLRGEGFGIVDLNGAGVQPVYVMDEFMRALCEFRSPQAEQEATVPVPCFDGDACVVLSRREKGSETLFISRPS